MKLRTGCLILVALSSMTAFAQVALDNAYQVRYAANLNDGDSVVDITNTGARGGVGLTSGTSASTPGAICANVYTFSPDEQMASCCSCPVTPNGLVSLSVKNDLISNTLTPAVPNSVVIKLLSTVPVGGSCTSSAGNTDTATLAPGMLAWGTTLRKLPSGAKTITETAFSPATLSASELAKLSGLCSFIQANGSGFGICRSCRLGGLATPR
jgi:hypothetical protein